MFKNGFPGYLNLRIEYKSGESDFCDSGHYEYFELGTLFNSTNKILVIRVELNFSIKGPSYELQFVFDLALTEIIEAKFIHEQGKTIFIGCMVDSSHFKTELHKRFVDLMNNRIDEYANASPEEEDFKNLIKALRTAILYLQGI